MSSAETLEANPLRPRYTKLRLDHATAAIRRNARLGALGRLPANVRAEVLERFGPLGQGTTPLLARFPLRQIINCYRLSRGMFSCCFLLPMSCWKHHISAVLG